MAKVYELTDEEYDNLLRFWKNNMEFSLNYYWQVIARNHKVDFLTIREPEGHDRVEPSRTFIAEPLKEM